MFTGVGERSREENDLWHKMRDSGVLKKTALVLGQMNGPPGARMRVGLTGLTVAEYFRDKMEQDVLLFIDNIFRFIQAGSEVSALLGRIPSAVGYQADSRHRHRSAAGTYSLRQKRFHYLRTGSLRSGGRLDGPRPGGHFLSSRCENGFIPRHY